MLAEARPSGAQAIDSLPSYLKLYSEMIEMAKSNVKSSPAVNRRVTQPLTLTSLLFIGK